jgi:hypothetical protein
MADLNDVGFETPPAGQEYQGITVVYDGRSEVRFLYPDQITMALSSDWAILITNKEIKND